MRSLKQLALCLTVALLASAAARPAPSWQTWTPEIRERARSEKRFILIDLEAVWCHWCHVMDHQTYADPRVQKELQEHFLCVKVDQDSRPDLANRYQDYGWPATIVLSPDGTEIVKKSGYLAPEEMLSLLRAIVADPSPVDYGDAPVERKQAGQFSPKLIARLQASYYQHYDPKLGGFSFAQKFLDWDSVEYALARGDQRSLRMARQTLDGELHLVDPVWGGVYQYSDSGVWTSPHYEKIMEHQTGNLRAFSQGYRQLGDRRYRQAIVAIRSFLLTFLRSPAEGAFMTSMDADLKPGQKATRYFALGDRGRRRLGLPRIDRHIYARENGWAIEALCFDYAATGDSQPLTAAQKAARWILAHRGLPGGGFSHGGNGAPYLGDTLAMGRAFLSLYECTGDTSWLHRAEAAATFMGAHFRPATGVGLTTGGQDGIGAPVVEREENIRAYRFLLYLDKIVDREVVPGLAQQALGYLALEPVATEVNTGGVLMAWRESQNDPVELTLVASPQDRLKASVLAYPAVSLVVRWQNPGSWKGSGGPPLILACQKNRCSQPMKTVAQVRRWLGSHNP